MSDDEATYRTFHGLPRLSSTHMGTDHGLVGPQIFIDFHDVVFCRRPSPRKKGKLPLPSVTIHLLGYMWDNISGVGTTKSSILSRAIYNPCATPSIYRMGIVIGPPPTQPRLVGAPISSLMFNFWRLSTLMLLSRGSLWKFRWRSLSRDCLEG